MKTSTRSIQTTLFGELEPSTLSAVASPANRTASAASDKAKRTRDTSGPKWPESFAVSDLVGYSLKMCLASALQRLTKCSVTWKRQATPHGRSWWVLAMSGPNTNGSESGSWATPMSGERHATPKSFKRGNPNLAQQATWATPHAHETGQYQYDQGDKTKPRATLTGQVLGWSTPRAADAEHAPATLSETILRREANGQANLAEQVQIWPVSGAGHQARADDSTTGKPQGSLNPDWVSQLMGFPDGWLHVAEKSD